MGNFLVFGIICNGHHVLLETDFGSAQFVMDISSFSTYLSPQHRQPPAVRPILDLSTAPTPPTARR